MTERTQISTEQKSFTVISLDQMQIVLCEISKGFTALTVHSDGKKQIELSKRTGFDSSSIWLIIHKKVQYSNDYLL